MTNKERIIEKALEVLKSESKGLRYTLLIQ